MNKLNKMEIKRVKENNRQRKKDDFGIEYISEKRKVDKI